MFNQGNNFLSMLPPATKNLLIINVLVWLAYLVLLRSEIDLGRSFALYYPASANFGIWQFVTYMFLHGSWGHIFLNMFGLFMFGRTMEMVWGTKRFLIFYFVTGIGAGLIHLLVTFIRIQILEASMSPEMIQMAYEYGAVGVRLINFAAPAQPLNLLINTPAVGASGAIFGILVAFAVWFPNEPLYLMFVPVPIKAKYLVIGMVVISLFFGFANLPRDPIAHFAHLGGMLFGILMILYWRKTDKKRNNYEHYYR